MEKRNSHSYLGSFAYLYDPAQSLRIAFQFCLLSSKQWPLVVSSLLNRRTLPVILLNAEVQVYMITCMKLAIVKQGTTGLFRYTSSLFSECDLCTLFSSTTERRYEGMYTECACQQAAIGPHFHIPCLFHFSPVFYVCVCMHMSVQVQMPMCTHAQTRRGYWGKKTSHCTESLTILTRQDGQTPGIWLPHSTEVTGT